MRAGGGGSDAVIHMTHEKEMRTLVRVHHGLFRRGFEARGPRQRATKTAKRGLEVPKNPASPLAIEVWWERR